MEELTVEVEAVLHSDDKRQPFKDKKEQSYLAGYVSTFLRNHYSSNGKIPNNDMFSADHSSGDERLWPSAMGLHLSRIRVCSPYWGSSQYPKSDPQSSHLKSYHWRFNVLFCSLSEDGSMDEYDDSGEGGSNSLPTVFARTWELPSLCFEGLWESLIFEDTHQINACDSDSSTVRMVQSLMSDVKQSLMHFVQTSLAFSLAECDRIVALNRLCLLHGPPGAGKTTLARSLAHKMSIRLTGLAEGSPFSECSLIEISAHSLFSKWFSESGKTIQRVFSSITDRAESESELFLFVLIDEIESLVNSRYSNHNGGGDSGSSGDPSDSVRAVNALLTQLDRLRGFPNIIVIGTSNLSERIDPAFIDRADLKLHVGLPGLKARTAILKSSVDQMTHKGMIQNRLEDLPLRDMVNKQRRVSFEASDEEFESEIWDEQSKIDEIAKECEGWSGRALRKLPLLAHTWFVVPNTLGDYSLIGKPVKRAFFLNALHNAAKVENHQRKAVECASS